MDAIIIKNLRKEYKDIIAVDGIDLSIKKGELFSLLGVNGAGKTTTIKMLSCLTKPSSGDAFLNGYSIINDAEKVKSVIAVSPQETAIASGLTARENLDLICGIHGYDKITRKEKLQKISDILHLNEILDKKSGKLSGGWQRKLSIAMALISDPQILFLDEPTLGLDVISRSELWDFIKLLKNNMTIILTTHYMEEAEALSDRIGIMNKGKLIFCGTSDEIKSKAETDNFEKAFIKIVKGENL